MAAKITNAEFKAAMLGDSGKMKLGFTLNIGSPLVAQAASLTGYDFVMVDAQHAPFDYEKMGILFGMIRAGGAKSFVRVSGAHDRSMIQQCYDLGVDGILVPYVNTAEDVIAAVSVSKYPDPDSKIVGTRSMYINTYGYVGTNQMGFAPVTASGETNKKTLVAVQIETADALKNIESICAVPGLDMAFIGPGDLTISMGLMQKHGLGAFSTPEFQQGMGAVVANCKKNNVAPGFWGSPGQLGMLGGAGFKFCVIGADIHTLVDAMKKQIEDSKEELKKINVEWKPTTEA